ncbi:hypothetical protein AQJ23_20520 [Streptomyces antibioticus]|nr:hypothetical protein AQJ23_20520 [Streptomyces antibioticus]
MLRTRCLFQQPITFIPIADSPVYQSQTQMSAPAASRAIQAICHTPAQSDGSGMGKSVQVVTTKVCGRSFPETSGRHLIATDTFSVLE